MWLLSSVIIKPTKWKPPFCGDRVEFDNFFNLIILVESLFAPDQTWVHFCETFSGYFCPIVQCILYYICVQCLCVKRPLSLFCVCEILRRRLLCNKSEGCLFNFGRCSQNRLSTKRSTVGWIWFQRNFIISVYWYNFEKLIAPFFRILKQTKKNGCTRLSRKWALFNFDGHILIAWNMLWFEVHT